MGKIRLAGVVKESIVDGPGIRYVVFTQGCPHNCKGCHNPHTHDFCGGYIEDTDKIYNEITSNPLVKGVTFSGGEPFMQAKELSELADKLKEKNYNIMAYTGFKVEHLLENSNSDNGYRDLLENTDILVDGKFELDKKNLLLKFRGSENQRVIDVNKTLDTGEIINYDI